MGKECSELIELEGEIPLLEMPAKDSGLSFPLLSVSPKNSELK